MKKIIIIGKKSFIGNNLKLYLQKKYIIKALNLNQFLKLKKKRLENVHWIINCSINNKYIKKKYEEHFDFDLKVARKISNLKCNFIFLSSRKIYKSLDNLIEKKNIEPKCNYSKNKLKTEKKLSAILKKRLLILRISNLIGLKNHNNSKRKIHDTFIDYFFRNVKKGIIFKNKKNYKDFLSIRQFSLVVEKLIFNNITGIYNVSMGKKVYLKNLIEWLNYYNRGKYMLVDLPKNFNDESFYLNNTKLKKIIKVNLNIKDLEKDCKILSKNFFKR